MVQLTALLYSLFQISYLAHQQVWSWLDLLKNYTEQLHRNVLFVVLFYCRGLQNLLETQTQSQVTTNSK